MSMLDGSVLEHRSGGIKSTSESTPKRPASPVEQIEQFEFAPKARQQDGVSMDERFDEWRAAARQTLESADRLAREHPDSSTAQARLTQAALIAGDQMVAVAAAKRALDIIARSSSTSDFGAAYVAISALVSSAEFELAERHFAQLPVNEALTMLMANALVDLNRLEDAESILDGCDAPNAPGLKGYIRLRLGDAQGAIGLLRPALAANPADADAALLLSKAFAATRSAKKAIRYARQASVLAPGRKDISLALIDALASYGQVDAALNEVRRLQASGVVETPDFLLVQAGLHLSQGNLRRSITLLKRARQSAAGDDVLQAEIDSNIANLRSSIAELTASQVLAVHRKSHQIAPRSVVVGEMLVEWLKESRDAPEARRVLEVLEEAGVPAHRLHPVAARVAYLEGDFEECLRRAALWNSREPGNQFAATVVAMIRGQLYEDWSGAAKVLAECWELGGRPASIANDLAYVLALGNETQEAFRVLAFAEKDHYVPLATRGLVLVASNQLQAGLKSYRDAATLADAEDIGEVARALMTVHQAMAFKRLDLDVSSAIEVRAGALPPVSLPNDWRNWPSFNLLQKAAERKGWTWPVIID